MSTDGETGLSASPLPFAFARRHGVVIDPEAVAGAGAALPLMARDTSSERAWREARRLLGKPISVTTCSEAAFLEAMERVYGERQRDDESLDIDVEIQIEDSFGRARVTDLLDDGEEAPVIQLINTLLRLALRRRASDMHIEAMEEGLRVRIRVDSILHTMLERKDAPVNRVVSRFKVMAGLDIAETRLPQDGRIALRYGWRSIDLRVSTMPSKHGERVVLRILDKSASLLSLSEIGLAPDEQAQVERMIATPHGLVLVTGPTGSGKTTTLYSVIQRLNDNRRNILTVEDPVEYDLPGISQTQVNAVIGMSFAAALRAILRQDPDIVLVGEIRDAETAAVAVQAALTGHLVLSTLHTNNALGAVTRLRDLELEPFLLASTLRGLISQRLVRRVCTQCVRHVPPDEDALELYYQSGLPVPAQVPIAVGCPDCSGIGYSGRVGVYEIVPVGRMLRDLIHNDRSEREMMQAVLPPETRLQASLLKAAANGVTTVGEAMRVFREGE